MDSVDLGPGLERLLILTFIVGWYFATIGLFDGLELWACIPRMLRTSTAPASAKFRIGQIVSRATA